MATKTLAIRIPEFIQGVKEILTVERTFKPNKHIHPSTDQVCLRKSSLEGLFSVTKTVTAESSIYMEIGNAVHTLIQRAAMERGNSKFTTFFVEYHFPTITAGGNELSISGRVDMVVYMKSEATGGKYKFYIVDIKTCNDAPDGIKSEHKKQMADYAAMMGLDVIVAYISREPLSGHIDLMNSSAFIYECNEQKSLDLLERYYLLSKHLQSGTIPKLKDDIPACKYCQFKVECKGNDYDGLEADDDVDWAKQAAKVAVADTINRQNGMLKFFQKYGSSEGKELLGKVPWHDV